MKVISQVRSSKYAKGANEGALDAVQVADRWHMLVNLQEAVELFFEQNWACLYSEAKAQIQPQWGAEVIDPLSKFLISHVQGRRYDAFIRRLLEDAAGRLSD